MTWTYNMSKGTSSAMSSLPSAWLWEDSLVIQGLTQLVNHHTKCVKQDVCQKAMGTTCSWRHQCKKAHNILTLAATLRNPRGKWLRRSVTLRFLSFDVRRCCVGNRVITFTCSVVRWQCIAKQSNCRTTTLENQAEKLQYIKEIFWQLQNYIGMWVMSWTQYPATQSKLFYNIKQHLVPVFNAISEATNHSRIIETEAESQWRLQAGQLRELCHGQGILTLLTKWGQCVQAAEVKGPVTSPSLEKCTCVWV